MVDHAQQQLDRVAARAGDPLVSFVVPVHNEVDSLAEFVAAVLNAVDAVRCQAEFVFVNDGSTDGTLNALLEMQREDKRIHIVNLSRNFGKEAALTAGLNESQGDVIVPIDVDLQDPPELLEPFLQKWHEGYDVVYGVRRNRRGDSLPIRLTAYLFYRIFNSVSSRSIPKDVGDFRLMDRRVVEAVLQVEERNRFMKGIFSWVGFRSTGVEYDRPERVGGASNWSIWKRWNFALDGVFSFSSSPLRVWTYLGLFMAVCCAGYALTIFGLAITGRISGVPGYASLLLTILFLGAAQLVSLGLIGEYLSRVLIEVKQRPLYLVEGVYSTPDSNSTNGDAEHNGNSQTRQRSGSDDQNGNGVDLRSSTASSRAEPAPALAADGSKSTP